MEHAGWRVPPGDIWQCLKTILVVATRGCYWQLLDEAMGVTKHPIMYRTLLTTNTQPKMSTVLRPRNFAELVNLEIKTGDGTPSIEK